MFLDIKELEVHPLDFEEEFPPDAIDLGDQARQRTPLNASGHAEVVEEHHGKHQIIQDIRLKGRLSTGIELQCARCLEPVPQQIKRDFELLYRPLGADAGLHTIPVNLDASRTDRRYRRVCDLRTDSIAGNKRYLMGHDLL